MLPRVSKGESGEGEIYVSPLGSGAETEAEIKKDSGGLYSPRPELYLLRCEPKEVARVYTTSSRDVNKSYFLKVSRARLYTLPYWGLPCEAYSMSVIS